MQLKKKYLAYAILPVLALVLIGATTAEAHGFREGLGGVIGWFGLPANPLPAEQTAQIQQQMFESKAQILGISVDEVKAAWAQGKSPKEVIEEKGLNQKEIQARAREAVKQRMAEHLQILVQQGVITQAQAEARLEFLQDRLESGMGHMGMKMGMGFHW